GDGQNVGAIIVRAARLQITEPSLFDLPRGTDLILAHAAAGVPDVVASRPVAAGPLPTATPVPWAPISAYRPIDVSLGNGNGDSDNFTLDNGNDNNAGGAATGGGGGTTGSTGTPIKIIVVVCTATPVPTATTAPGVPNPTNTPTPIICK